MKKIVLFASIILASGLFLSNVYNSIIDARSWASNVPQSVEVLRNYYKITTPGDFYRVFSPLNQVLMLITFILFWKSTSTIRTCFGIAFILYVGVDIFTFTYFYPRLDIIFKSPISDIDAIRNAVSDWSNMNWVRSMMLLAGIILSCFALHKIYTPGNNSNF
jgi:hypothetical protein